MKLFDFFKRNKNKDKEEDKKQAPLEVGKPLSETDYSLHPAIENVVWFRNGPKENYNPDQKAEKDEFYLDGFNFTVDFSLSGDNEPSAIDTSLLVGEYEDLAELEKLPFFPTYSGMTPSQRRAYLEYLSDPYNTTFEMGYVFLLYYGLERFLLTDKFEDAFDFILELRDIHDNDSFQYYSANSLILSCIYHQRPDMMMKFIDSIDHEYERNFSANLFLMSVYTFDIPLDSRDIIRLRNDFEFTNNTYISKYPDMFEKTLTQLIKYKYGVETIPLSDVLSKSQFNKLKLEEVNMFANISISDNVVKVPLISDSFMLKKTFHDLLVENHEAVKQIIAELKKNGELPPPEQKPTPKDNKVLAFDYEEEKQLVDELKDNSQDPVERHFSYVKLQNFYYKFSNLDNKYLEECIKYCYKDINSLDEMQVYYRTTNLDKLERISSVYEEKELASMIKDIKNGYSGNIPAFKKLAVIYEKDQDYDKAVDICNAAISYYRRLKVDTREFEDRKGKLINMIKGNIDNIKEYKEDSDEIEEID